MSDFNRGQVVYTQKAKCRDCYHCLRICPVKAIKVSGGQAYVDESRCIACGTCIKECPQGAKTYRDDVYAARQLLDGNDIVVASVAPSFAAVFNGWESKRLPSALRMLGFSYVEETAEAAYRVADASLRTAIESGGSNIICSACPAVVSYMEKYHSDMLDSLIPVVSPMIAHARILKNMYGNQVKIVFIGPCVAKKYEAQREEYNGLVDSVITFKELGRWLEQSSVDLSKCEESSFDSRSGAGYARLFPVEGGLLKTAGIDNDPANLEVLCLSGINRIEELLGSSFNKLDSKIIEPLFCMEGCINGPGISLEKSILERRSDLLKHAASQASDNAIIDNTVDMSTVFTQKKVDTMSEIEESRILEVLSLTGKSDKSNQLNCGACGYKSCRENAKAVIMGMAEIEMCMPYMKRLAEQRTDKIIDTIPNGIVILDEKLCIIGMNPAFRKYFDCSDDTLNRKISYLFNSNDYEKLISGVIEEYESVINYNGTKYHQVIYSLKQEKQYVGIYINMSQIQMDDEKLSRLKLHTIRQARELLENQIDMAQAIAKFLGESTARGEELIWRLMSIYDDNK